MVSSQPEAITLQEGKYWRVLLNPNQSDLGKSLVVIKSNKSSLAELSGSEWEEFGEIAKRFEQVVSAEFNPTHFNWQCLMNNAYETDSDETPHVHWHASPRYNRPVMVGEHEFIDQNYPRTNKEAKIVGQAVLELIASRIRLEGDN